MMLEVVGQPIANVPVDLAVRTPRIAIAEVVGPAFQLPIDPDNQVRNRRTALRTIRKGIDRIPFPLQ